jgi:predicted permease
VVYLVSFLCALIIPAFMKGSGFETGVLRFMLIFSNLGFMGYPVANAMFGGNRSFMLPSSISPSVFLVFTVGCFCSGPTLHEILI